MKRKIDEQTKKNKQKEKRLAEIKMELDTYQSC